MWLSTLALRSSETPWTPPSRHRSGKCIVQSSCVPERQHQPACSVLEHLPVLVGWLTDINHGRGEPGRGKKGGGGSEGAHCGQAMGAGHFSPAQEKRRDTHCGNWPSETNQHSLPSSSGKRPCTTPHSAAFSNSITTQDWLDSDLAKRLHSSGRRQAKSRTHWRHWLACIGRDRALPRHAHTARRGSTQTSCAKNTTHKQNKCVARRPSLPQGPHSQASRPSFDRRAEANRSRGQPWLLPCPHGAEGRKKALA